MNVWMPSSRNSLLYYTGRIYLFVRADTEPRSGRVDRWKVCSFTFSHAVHSINLTDIRLMVGQIAYFQLHFFLLCVNTLTLSSITWHLLMIGAAGRQVGKSLQHLAIRNQKQCMWESPHSKYQRDVCGVLKSYYHGAYLPQCVIACPGLGNS